MMIDFFGTTPGLLSLAALALVLILTSVFRRLAARARARRAAPGPAAAPAGEARLPRWALAAVAAWAASEAGGGARDAPSAAAWTAAAGGRDPWLEAGWRRAGVTK